MNATFEDRLTNFLAIKDSDAQRKQAFEALFPELHSWLLSTAKRKLRCTTIDSEDVVQETIFRIWQRAHLFDRSKGSALAWVACVLRNLVQDTLRKKQHYPQIASLYDDTGELAV